MDWPGDEKYGLWFDVCDEREEAGVLFDVVAV